MAVRKRTPKAKTRRVYKRAAPKAKAKAGVRSKRGARNVGRLPASKKRATVANPKRLHSGVRRAVELYSSFHGTTPKWIDEYTIKVPNVAMLAGRVVAIEYITPHNRRDQFRHEFTGKSRPMLAVGSDGRQLLLLGGEYYFNDHGIIDGTP